MPGGRTRPRGLTGAAGAVGAQGPQGIQGPQGPQGIQGDPGNTPRNWTWDSDELIVGASWLDASNGLVDPSGRADALSAFAVTESGRELRVVSAVGHGINDVFSGAVESFPAGDGIRGYRFGVRRTDKNWFQNSSDLFAGLAFVDGDLDDAILAVGLDFFGTAIADGLWALYDGANWDNTANNGDNFALGTTIDMMFSRVGLVGTTYICDPAGEWNEIDSRAVTAGAGLMGPYIWLGGGPNNGETVEVIVKGRRNFTQLPWT